MGVSRLIGSWESKELRGAVYVFEEEGKGYYSFFGATKGFDYVDNGDSVKIHYIGDYAASLFKYSIEGKTLVISDSFGNLNDYILIE